MQKITLKINKATLDGDDIKVGWEVTLDYGKSKSHINGEAKVGEEIELPLTQHENGETYL